MRRFENLFPISITIQMWAHNKKGDTFVFFNKYCYVIKHITTGLKVLPLKVTVSFTLFSTKPKLRWLIASVLTKGIWKFISYLPYRAWRYHSPIPNSQMPICSLNILSTGCMSIVAIWSDSSSYTRMSLLKSRAKDSTASSSIRIWKSWRIKIDYGS
jgi:hypothetical protein